MPFLPCYLLLFILPVGYQPHMQDGCFLSVVHGAQRSRFINGPIKLIFMRILFSVVTLLFLSFLALHAPITGRLNQPVLAQTVPQSPTPSWQITNTATNIATFIVDYRGKTVKEVYFLQDPSCATPLTETLLITTARAAISNTMTGRYMALTLHADGKIAESTRWDQDLFSWSTYFGDFTAQAWLAPCSGQVIFAGESVWMGEGVRPVLHTPLPTTELMSLPTSIPLPSALTIIAGPVSMQQPMEDAWVIISHLNLMHDLAQQPFKVLALLYRPATGYIDPVQELAQAEWIFLVYTGTTPRAQTQFEHYLPLVRK